MTDKSPDCPYLYFLFVEVHPEKGKAYLEWQNNKHIPEVLSDPAFLWVRKVKVRRPDNRDDTAWDRYIILYGIKSLEDFHAYRKSDLFKSFAPELQKFKGTFRASRFLGPVDMAIG